MFAESGSDLEIVDIREPEEYDLVRIKNSKLIPFSQLRGRMDEINWNKRVVIVCRSGSRSGYVSQILSQSGKDVLNLARGIYELNLNNCKCLEKSENCCEGYF